jgi:hypothetical protein
MTPVALFWRGADFNDSIAAEYSPLIAKKCKDLPNAKPPKARSPTLRLVVCRPLASIQFRRHSWISFLHRALIGRAGADSLEVRLDIRERREVFLYEGSHGRQGE